MLSTQDWIPTGRLILGALLTVVILTGFLSVQSPSRWKAPIGIVGVLLLSLLIAKGLYYVAVAVAALSFFLLVAHPLLFETKDSPDSMGSTTRPLDDSVTR